MIRLDVRSVEPRDRFERIMGAWERLRPGDSLALTVDHDPKCMYYTLLAEQGEEAFDFEYLESGPLDWTVRVEKRAARTG